MLKMSQRARNLRQVITEIIREGTLVEKIEITDF